MPLGKLTEKQRRFADNYIECGSAHKAALDAGYSKTYAKTDAHTMLENPRIRSYIDERLDKLKSEKVANQQEILEFLTSVMRGEQTEETLRGIGEGAQTIDDIEVDAAKRIKAAELLGKRYAMWTDKQQIDGDLSITVEVDYGDD